MHVTSKLTPSNVNQFVAVTATDAEAAAFYLSAMGDDLNRAVNFYFSSGGTAHTAAASRASARPPVKQEPDATQLRAKAASNKKEMESNIKKWKADLTTELCQFSVTSKCPCIAQKAVLDALVASVDQVVWTIKDFMQGVPTPVIETCGIDVFEFLVKFRAERLPAVYSSAVSSPQQVATLRSRRLLAVNEIERPKKMPRVESSVAAAAAPTEPAGSSAQKAASAKPLPKGKKVKPASSSDSSSSDESDEVKSKAKSATQGKKIATKKSLSKPAPKGKKAKSASSSDNSSSDESSSKESTRKVKPAPKGKKGKKVAANKPSSSDSESTHDSSDSSASTTDTPPRRRGKAANRNAVDGTSPTSAMSMEPCFEFGRKKSGGTEMKGNCIRPPKAVRPSKQKPISWNSFLDTFRAHLEVLELVSGSNGYYAPLYVTEKVPRQLMCKTPKDRMEIFNSVVQFDCIPHAVAAMVSNANDLAAALKVCCSQCKDVPLIGAALKAHLRMQLALNLTSVEQLCAKYDTPAETSSPYYDDAPDWEDPNDFGDDVYPPPLKKIVTPKVEAPEPVSPFMTQCSNPQHVLLCHLISALPLFAATQKPNKPPPKPKVTVSVERCMQKVPEPMKCTVKVKAYSSRSVKGNTIIPALQRHALTCLMDLVSGKPGGDVHYPNLTLGKIEALAADASAWSGPNDLVNACAITEDADMPRTATPKDILMPLKPHQQEDLAFMLNREHYGTADYATFRGDGFMLFYCPATIDFIVTRMNPKDHAHLIDAINPVVRGGLLCDEMGLGKTLVLTALITQNPYVPSDQPVTVPFIKQFHLRTLRPDLNVVKAAAKTESDSDSDTAENVNQPHLSLGGIRHPISKPEDLAVHLPKPVVDLYMKRHELIPIRATLVVTPVSICGQWASELARANPNLRVMLFHGTERARYTVESFSAVDVVITTYETLSSQLRTERSHLQQYFAATLPLKEHHQQWLDMTLRLKKQKDLAGKLALLKTYFPFAGHEVDDAQYYSLLTRIVYVSQVITDYVPCPLTKFKFHRIVMDESQKALCSSLEISDLHATYIWHCSGTPLNNNIPSMNSIFRSLGCTSTFCSSSRLFDNSMIDLKPTAYGSLFIARYEYWHQVTASAMAELRLIDPSVCSQLDLNEGHPAACLRYFAGFYASNSGYNRSSWLVLHYLRRYMVRHMKGASIIDAIALPKRTMFSVAVTLEPHERAVYQRIATQIRDQLKILLRQDRVGNRIGRIHMWLDLLSRLACHAGLASGSSMSVDASDTDGTKNENAKHLFVPIEPPQLIEELKARKNVPDCANEIAVKMNGMPPIVDECGVCFDTMSAPTMLPCCHFFCRECVLGSIASKVALRQEPSCPLCNSKTISGKKLVINVNVNELDVGEETESLLEIVKKIGDGSKCKAVLAIIARTWQTAPETKFVIFSRFPSFLQMLSKFFASQNVKTCLIDGSTSLQKRASFITEFQHPQSLLRVCIISSRAGNAGLTLTAASHLILCEPNMNQALEAQAMGRIHRFGQTQDVSIHRLYAIGTVEEKIFKLSCEDRLGGGDAAESFVQRITEILSAE